MWSTISFHDRLLLRRLCSCLWSHLEAHKTWVEFFQWCQWRHLIVFYFFLKTKWIANLLLRRVNLFRALKLCSSTRYLLFHEEPPSSMTFFKRMAKIMNSNYICSCVLSSVSYFISLNCEKSSFILRRWTGFLKNTETWKNHETVSTLKNLFFFQFVFNENWNVFKNSH